MCVYKYIVVSVCVKVCRVFFIRVGENFELWLWVPKEKKNYQQDISWQIILFLLLFFFFFLLLLLLLQVVGSHCYFYFGWLGQLTAMPSRTNSVASELKKWLLVCYLTVVLLARNNKSSSKKLFSRWAETDHRYPTDRRLTSNPLQHRSSTGQKMTAIQ